MWNVIADPIYTIQFLLHWLRHRTLAQRKFPSVVLRHRTPVFSLEFHGEQLPNPDSRVTLARYDPFGMPRVKVDWRYTPGDVRAMERALEVVKQEIERSGCGRFEYDTATVEQEIVRYGAYGGHQIGTARMGADPLTSVVDGDCKVHGVENLHIASSAVFPTSSQANPTLTIVALALRLATTARTRAVRRIRCRHDPRARPRGHAGVARPRPRRRRNYRAAAARGARARARVPGDRRHAAPEGPRRFWRSRRT